MKDHRPAALLAISAAVLAASAAPAGQPPGPERPNILYVMSDDHAAHAIGAYGSKVNETPAMDRLAREGMRFDRCFAVNSICTPSRATILTGLYSHVNGVPAFNPLDGSLPNLAKYLQAAGYHTGVIGKWHLGSDPTGFDHWEILPGQGVYFDPVLYDRDGARRYRGYVTDVLADLAVGFMTERPPGKPFLLLLHNKAPHRAWDPDEKHRARFAGREIPEPPTLRDDGATRADAFREHKQSVFRDMNRRDLKLRPPPGLRGKDLQEWLGTKPVEVEVPDGPGTKVLKGDALERWKYQRYMQDYLACIASIDDNLGLLLDWMDARGLSENTIVIYTSDQGFFLGEHGMYDKRFMYEESIRMPFIVRWPGKVRPGSVCDALVTNPDFAPTFLDVAGVPAPAHFQGRSIVPLLQGVRPADWRTSFYYRYYHDPGHHDTRAHYGVRTETHKLLYFWKKDQWECFDLVRDPLELRNIYADPTAASVVASLKEELRRLRLEVGDDDRFADKLPEDGVDGPPKKWKPGYEPPAVRGGRGKAADRKDRSRRF
jgi:arylsulfatase A-like enzyme